MIKDFRDRWLQDFYIEDKSSKKVPAIIKERLFRKLQLIDDAAKDLDLRLPPSNHFEKLTGRLKEYHSIRVNDQWRLIFKWGNYKGEAEDLYLDNHSYRG